MRVETLPCVTGRTFEATAEAGAALAMTSGDSVLIMFDDIAVQIDPGDDAASISRSYDQTVEAVRRRLNPVLPLVSETGRTPGPGDLIETQEDDHFSRLMKGTVGIVTNVDMSNGAVSKIVVRFARRTVDYVPEDLSTLRYFR